MISSNLFELKVIKANSYNYTSTNESIFQTLESTKSELPKILMKYSNEDEDQIIRKTEFNECIQFASLVPFLLQFDSKEERAVIAYLTATIIMNEFYNKYYK